MLRCEEVYVCIILETFSNYKILNDLMFLKVRRMMGGLEWGSVFVGFIFEIFSNSNIRC